MLQILEASKHYLCFFCFLQLTTSIKFIHNSTIYFILKDSKTRVANYQSTQTNFVKIDLLLFQSNNRRLSLIQMSQSHKITQQSPSEFRHGLQYISREKQPSMFQILSWEHNPIQNKEWLLKMQPNYTEPNFTEPQKYQKPQKHTFHQQARGQESPNEIDKKDKGHKVLSQLYYYGDEELKHRKIQGLLSPKKEAKLKNKQKQVKRLDQFNEFQKKEIQRRKKNIQNFTGDTRQLPDSAFTTYFGKPTFAAYGIGSKSDTITKHKSHSVMPHAGKNQPEFVQSHEGALNKANVINLNLRVPKKPAFPQQNQDVRVKVSEYYNVEIVKPDLVNETKFANQDLSLKAKQKTPKHNQISILPKRVYEPFLTKDKSKKKGKRVKSQQKDDGLSFMFRRQHFWKDIEQKKKNHNKIAYKPTECYPLDWDYQTSAHSTAKIDKWKQVQPAGVSSATYLKAQSWWNS